MALKAGQYNLQCWNSTTNPDQMNRPKLLFQCFELIKALQKEFTNGEIAIPSTDSKPSRKGIEICIFHHADSSLFGDVADFLTRIANSMGLDYRNFVEQEVSMTRYFDEDEIANISTLAEPFPDGITEASIAAMIDQAKDLNRFRINDKWRNGISGDQRSVSLSIARSTLQRFHEVEGDDLAKEIKRVIDGVSAVSQESKSSVALLMSVATGIFAISEVDVLPSNVRQYVALVISWTVSFSVVATAFGNPIAAVLSAIEVGVHVLRKDAINILIVINDTQNDVMPVTEYIKNGERRLVPEVIPASQPNSKVVSVGMFVYGKYQIKSNSIGTYGSAFGVSFDAGDESFSIGMDCPNTLAGGNNSIEVHNEENAERACQMAVDSGCTHGWINSPRVDVKIAGQWGKVNWGRAIIWDSGNRFYRGGRYIKSLGVQVSDSTQKPRNVLIQRNTAMSNNNDCNSGYGGNYAYIYVKDWTNDPTEANWIPSFNITGSAMHDATDIGKGTGGDYRYLEQNHNNTVRSDQILAVTSAALWRSNTAIDQDSVKRVTGYKYLTNDLNAGRKGTYLYIIYNADLVDRNKTD